MADIEKAQKAPHISTFDIEDPVSPPSSSSSHDLPNSATQRIRQNSVIKGRGPLARLRYYEALLDKKLGIEGAGPERILPEDRKPPRSWMMALVWASGTMNLSCFTTGFLGWEFGLSLKQSVLCMIFGTLLGAMLTVRIHLNAFLGGLGRQLGTSTDKPEGKCYKYPQSCLHDLRTMDPDR